MSTRNYRFTSVKEQKHEMLRILSTLSDEQPCYAPELSIVIATVKKMPADRFANYCVILQGKHFSLNNTERTVALLLNSL